ncbi:HesB/IscA family protein [Ornithinimicrobium sp. Y1694]|uniref:HesB/IscA family protein n=1 Tax=Ornithinimicrobium sp. Y1694 TaxID=3418590 RepID=UPI003CEEDFD7
MAEQTTFPPFEVTQEAIQALVDLGGAVRLDIEPGGCCGTTYTYALADPDVDPNVDPAHGEHRYGCPGAWLLVTQRAAAVLTGARLDYGAKLKPPRFRVTRNPNTPEVCACRRSFGQPWPGPNQPTCRSYEPMPWDTEYEPPGPWRRRTAFDERRDEQQGKG